MNHRQIAVSNRYNDVIGTFKNNCIYELLLHQIIHAKTCMGKRQTLGLAKCVNHFDVAYINAL